MFFDEDNNGADDSDSFSTIPNPETSTLEEILTSPYFLQEFQSGNVVLLATLYKEESMMKLLQMALQPTIDSDLPLKDHFKLANMSALALAHQFSQITSERIISLYEKILKTKKFSDYFFGFLPELGNMNTIVVGFYVKILRNMLKDNFDEISKILITAEFWRNILPHIHMGAIFDLAFDALKVRETYEERQVLAEFWQKENFVEILLDVMVKCESDGVNENCMDLFCDVYTDIHESVVRGTDRVEVLDTFNSSANITRITDVMLDYEENKSSRAAISLVKSTAKMLDCIVTTNTFGLIPSRVLELEEITDNCDREALKRHYELSHLQFQEGKTEQEVKAFFEHLSPPIYDTLVTRVSDIIRLTDQDLKAGGVVWQSLLKLLVVIVNTNDLNVHDILLNEFRTSVFIDMFDSVKKYKKRSVLHSLLHQLVTYPMYARQGDDNKSPLAMYILESGILKRIAVEAEAKQVAGESRIDTAAYRTFYINIGLTMFKFKSRYGSTAVSQLLLMKSEWPDIERVVLKYVYENRIDIPESENDSEQHNNSSSFMSHEGFDSGSFGRSSDDFAEDGKFSSMFLRPSISGGPHVDFDDLAPRMSKEEFDQNLEESVNAEEFWKRCSMLSSSQASLDGREEATPAAEKVVKEEWPGAVEETSEAETGSMFEASFDAKFEDMNKPATTAADSGNWADFGALEKDKKASCSKAESDWPPLPTRSSARLKAAAAAAAASAPSATKKDDDDDDDWPTDISGKNESYA